MAHLRRASGEILYGDDSSDSEIEESFQSAVSRTSSSRANANKEDSSNNGVKNSSGTTTPMASTTATRSSINKNTSIHGAEGGGFIPEEEEKDSLMTDDSSDDDDDDEEEEESGTTSFENESGQVEDDYGEESSSDDDVLVPATPEPVDRNRSSSNKVSSTPDSRTTIEKDRSALSLRLRASIPHIIHTTPSSSSSSGGGSKRGSLNSFPLHQHQHLKSRLQQDIEVIQIQDTPVSHKPIDFSPSFPFRYPSSSSSSSPVSTYGQKDTVEDEWIPVRSLFSSDTTVPKDKEASPHVKKKSVVTLPEENEQETPQPKKFNFKPLLPTSVVASNPAMNRSKTMTTSTPLMSNNRKGIKNVFEELDETGISVVDEEGEDEIQELPQYNNKDERNDSKKSNSEAGTLRLDSRNSGASSSSGTSSSASGGYRVDQSMGRRRQEDSDIEIVYDDDEEEQDADEEVDSEESRRKIPDKKDLDEITERLKKQHLHQKNPLVQYLENLPTTTGGGGSGDAPNPFSSINKPPRTKKGNFMSADRINGARGDVYKSIELLAEIIDAMPMSEDDNSDFVIPTQLTVKLYPHQVYGTKWMSWREGVYPGGGILADEMGLGKTIMAIALILTGKHAPREDRENWFSSENKKLVPSRATLVVCPKGCISQWENELKSKAKKLNVVVYHGSNRTQSAALLAQSDVVLTTYPTLSSEIPKPDDDPQNRCRSPLIRIQWERIMLDEGHTIRNPKTHCALAACRINAYHRWVITGTPVHNSPEDFYSLIRFLDFEPFSDNSVWVHWIGKKQVHKGSAAERLHLIGKALLLRRTKEEVSAASTEVDRLPPKHVEDIQVKLSESEEPVYTYMFDYAKSLMTKFLDQQQDRKEEMQNAANNYVAGAMKRGRHKNKNNDDEGEMRFSTILTLITRLRQLAVLPYLIRTMLADEDEGASDNEDSYDPLNDPINANNPIFEIGFKSSKIKAVLAQLKLLRDDAEAKGEPMEKVIIVSSWTSFLDIMQQHLTKRGYSSIGLDGRLEIAERSDVMNKFNSNPKKPQIMLLSINAGGVGLNLTGANHVFFIEPQWNPQIERQAQDRVHRYGQKKPVFIKRFIAQSSFEERVMQIQLGKLELADGLLSNTKKSRGAGLNVQDLKKLFDL